VADADSSFGEKVRTIAARPWFKVSNEGLQLGGPALELMWLIKYSFFEGKESLPSLHWNTYDDVVEKVNLKKSGAFRNTTR
jgi:hypothetical protein